MLKGISPLLSPDLLKILCEMGHGDEICIGDGNFPAASVGSRVVRMDGHGIPDIFEAILSVFPLDTYVARPVALMQVVPGDPVATPIWEEYFDILARYDSRGRELVGQIERHAFYERARTCHAVIATGEPALYANIILKKGVVR